MIKVCESCGTEYADHAEYCNVCKRSSLVVVHEPEPERSPPQRLIEDGPTLALTSALWLLGLGVLLGDQRPRSATTLLLGWLFLTGVTAVIGLTMKNVRLAVIVSLLGGVFFVLYGLVRLQ